MDDGRPISYMALEVGTAVVTSSGTKFGEVEHVLQVPELDLFDGIAVDTHAFSLRFVDRDQIGDITTTVVHCTFDDDAVAQLPAPHGNKVLRPDLGDVGAHGLSAWYGKLFRRDHWKEIDN